MEIMIENEAYSDLIGDSEAPNINKLAQNYGLGTASYAIGHPSLPDYLEMISGSNYGVVDDGTPQSENIASTAQTLANQLDTAGLSWRAYFESMPSAGYTGGDAGGIDPYGNDYYFQHHNPFAYFPAVTSLADFNQNVVPLTSVGAVQHDLNAANAPDFVWVTPNTINDMHDGPALPDGSTVPTVGDAWLANFIANVQSTSWYAAGGQIVVQWDEGLDSDHSGVGTAGQGGGGQIVTLVVSANLAAHPIQYSTPFNTAGILHSVEATYGLSYLLDAGSSNNGNINTLMGLAIPTVSSVSPNTGPIGGGTSVTVTGSGFTGATTVKFGSAAAVSFSVTSSTTLTAVSPAGSSGPVDVTVTTPAGTSATSAADTFTYGNPVVIQRAATFPVNSESVMNSSITVNPQKVGDLMILSDQLHSTSVDVTAVSGGNSGTWHLAEQFIDTPNTLTFQVWYAVATGTGSSEMTLTYSAHTTLPVELIADSFTSSLAVTWNVVASGGVSNASSTSVVFPTLTSGSAPGELYWGASEEHATGVAGTTPGFVYGQTSEANEYLDNVGLSPNSTYSPLASQTPPGVATTAGVIFSS